MTSTTTVPIAGALDVPGARLYFEVRGDGPLLVLVGAPMDATAFAHVADLLAEDYLVLTTDPRGIHRSPVVDHDQDSTPQLRGDDLARLITDADAGPAIVLGSSGGAVSVLALVEVRPDLVDTAVAHEPPLSALLDDREQLFAGSDEMIATYLSGDTIDAWRMFLRQADIHLPEPMFQQMFAGERDAQALADDRFQWEHMMRATTRWQPDIPALRSVPSRIVVAIGDQSAGQFCDRSSRALAEALALEPTMFPGGHTGFVQNPPLFAVRLREVLNQE